MTLPRENPFKRVRTTSDGRKYTLTRRQRLALEAELDPKFKSDKEIAEFAGFTPQSYKLLKKKDYYVRALEERRKRLRKGNRRADEALEKVLKVCDDLLDRCEGGTQEFTLEELHRISDIIIKYRKLTFELGIGAGEDEISAEKLDAVRKDIYLLMFLGNKYFNDPQILEAIVEDYLADGSLPESEEFKGWQEAAEEPEIIDITPEDVTEEPEQTNPE